MKKTIILSIGLLALAALAAQGAQVESSAYRTRLDLTTPAGQAPDDLYAFRLPPELFRDTLDSLDDIRLADEKGQAVPFEITRRTELAAVTQQVAVAAARTGFSENNDDNSIEITFSLTADQAAPAGLRIVTPLKNFEKEVDVFGSRDKSTWSKLTTAVIFDASRFMDVSRTEILFSDAGCRHFRLVLHDVSDSKASPVSEISRFNGRAGSGEPQYTDRQNTILNRDFRIDRIDFFRQDILPSVAHPRLIPYPVTNLTVKVDEPKNQTVVRFEAGRIPLTRLTILSDARNFSRSFVLYADDPDRRFDQPRPVLARGTLRHLDFRTINLKDLAVNLPESRRMAYELIIENGDNPPLSVSGIILEGPELQALFMAPPASRIRLYAVNPKAVKPRFDTTVIRMALDRGLMGHMLPEAHLEANPDWRRSGGFSFNKKAALGGALVVMALVLGAALFKAARRMESGGGDSSSAT
jgi:hypothetical protein